MARVVIENAPQPFLAQLIKLAKAASVELLVEGSLEEQMQEAMEEIRRGEVVSFDSYEEFLQDLRS